ncbi:MAG TPA: Slp family lipoprotein, partial [Nitrospiraceae bacterium]|nr:Slp family lipoprotein [Nitrospiraceae bacterium]
MDEHAMTSRHDRNQHQATRAASQVWLATLVGIVVASGFDACATIPRKYLKQAEPGVTLTMLASHPDAYRGKVVILGGTVVTQKEESGRIWLLVENRPLDTDYVPQLPTSPNDPEAGEYWIMVTPEGLPKTSRNWARLTVVGRVSDERPAQHAPGTGREPVLAALYLRGWGSGMGGYGL